MKTKNLFLSMLAMASVLFVTSCSQEDVVDEPIADFVNATFAISTADGIGTRAVIGDGTKVDKVACAVYDAEGVELEDLYQIVPIENKTATYKIRLAKGQNYRVAFFAYNAAANAYDVEDLKNVVFNPEPKCNVEERDAFTNYYDVKPGETMSTLTREVTLYRPFAQLNLGIDATELADAEKAGIVVAKSKIIVSNVHNAFSAFDNAVVANNVAAEMEFALNAIPTEPLMVDVDGDGTDEPYTYLALNYLLVGNAGTEKTLTDIEFIWEGTEGETNNPTTNFVNIPVQRNYRTNIVGKLLTNPAQFNIKIDNKFDGEYNSMEILEHALENGGEVSLFSDMTLDEDFTIAADKEVSINMNGNTLTVKSTGTVEGKLSISNGNINANVDGDSDLNFVFYAKDGSTIEFKDANVNVADGSAAVMVYDVESTVNVENTTITSVGEGGGICSFFDGDLTLNVVNSELSGEYAVYIMMAEAVVNVDENSTINKFQVASTSKVDVVYEGNKPTVTEDGTANTITYYSPNQFALKEVLENGGVMTLDSDFTIDEAIYVEAGKDVTIDMNGKTLNIAAVNDLEGNLTLKNGDVNVDIPGSGLRGAFVPTGDGHVTVDNADVTVANSNALAAVFTQDGSLRETMNAVIDIVDSEITVEQGGYGVCVPFDVNYVELNLKNSTISGKNGFVALDQVINALITLDATSSIEEIYVGSGNNVSIVYKGNKPNVIEDGNVTYYTDKAVYDFNQALQEGTASDLTLVEGVDYGTITVDELKDVTITGAEGATMIFKTTADTKIENVTLKSVNFKYTGATLDCGIIINGSAQINNLVIDGCTVTGTGEKKGRGISGTNPNASIVVKNCNFKDLGYPIHTTANNGGYKSLTVENCTFENIKSWAIMPQYNPYSGDLTVTGCTFKNCLKGGLVKTGAFASGKTFTFTNNIITNCSGHDGNDSEWFSVNTSAANKVVSGNTKDGVDWTPDATNGLN